MYQSATTTYPVDQVVSLGIAPKNPAVKLVTNVAPLSYTVKQLRIPNRRFESSCQIGVFSLAGSTFGILCQGHGIWDLSATQHSSSVSTRPVPIQGGIQ